MCKCGLTNLADFTANHYHVCVHRVVITCTMFEDSMLTLFIVSILLMLKVMISTRVGHVGHVRTALCQNYRKVFPSITETSTFGYVTALNKLSLGMKLLRLISQLSLCKRRIPLNFELKMQNNQSFINIISYSRHKIKHSHHTDSISVKCTWYDGKPKSNLRLGR